MIEPLVKSQKVPLVVVSPSFTSGKNQLKQAALPEEFRQMLKWIEYLCAEQLW